MVKSGGSIWGVMPYSCKRRGGDGADGGHGPGRPVSESVFPHQPGEVVDRARTGEGEDVHPARLKDCGGLRGHGQRRQGRYTGTTSTLTPSRTRPSGSTSRACSARARRTRVPPNNFGSRRLPGAPRPGRCRAPPPPPGYSSLKAWAVAGPMTASLARPKARTSSPIWKSRSMKARTPLALVKMTQS